MCIRDRPRREPGLAVASGVRVGLGGRLPDELEITQANEASRRTFEELGTPGECDRFRRANVQLSR
eukprot:6526025-Alexandrium_andersonii.AAC.1